MLGLQRGLKNWAKKPATTSQKRGGVLKVNVLPAFVRNP
jgi:hypothetical protein